ncbi:hypothetical protein [Herbaspirillum rubrisubalbicans]|uniref:hypothetical protein n=1 Tax=Herbaspirillum rubrisubalbicans TaxID=80842 RepID=UPI0015C5374B|nr:hypothetical protein [Herbaspirillum rubrisubalbicans]
MQHPIVEDSPEAVMVDIKGIKKRDIPRRARPACDIARAPTLAPSLVFDLSPSFFEFQTKTGTSTIDLYRLYF